MATTAPTTGYAPVNGLQMYYEVHGEGGTPLMLLHGSFMTIDLNWGELLPRLSESRQVIAVEMQAHGRTGDVDRPLTYAGLADDVAALIRHLGIDRADLLGYSLGGGVALRVAIRHPELVRKLVVVSSPFLKDGWYPEVAAGVAGITAEMLAQTPLGPAYRELAPNPEAWPALIDKVKTLDADPDDPTPDDIDAIAASTMLLVGDADGVSLEHAVAMFRRLGGGVFGDYAGVPPSRLAVVPGATHVGLMMQTDLLARLITPFLDEATPDAGAPTQEQHAP